MNNLQVFKNEKLNLEVRTIQNEDGSISISSEDAAIGFGFTQVKNNRKYVRWETMNGYCSELGFSQQIGKDDYIPESLFYMLGMKASNKVAQEQKEEIYKSLLKDFDLGDFEGIKVVSENKEKLKEKLIYIGENNIL